MIDKDLQRLITIDKRIKLFQNICEALKAGDRVEIAGSSFVYDIDSDPELSEAFKTFAEDQLVIYKKQFDKISISYNTGVEYMPTCPKGYSDCVNDPARIMRFNPEFYKELYGDIPVVQATKQRCAKGMCFYDNGL